MNLMNSFSRCFSALILTVVMAIPVSLMATTSPMTAVDGFIANVGQWPSEVLYLARQNGTNVWITRTGVVEDRYAITASTGVRSGIVVREAFQNVNFRSVASSGPEVSRVTFIKGNDPNNWYSATVHSYVAVMDLYPGVSFMFRHGGDGRIERTMIAREGADLSQISRELLGSADPVLAEITPITSTVYGTYFGGPSTDVVSGIEYLSNGDIVAAGTTPELEFPGVVGGYTTTVKGPTDGFLVRFDPKLQKVRAFSFIGGTGDDRVRAFTKDAQNNLYVTGETNSTDFPTTSGVSGKLYKAGLDAFVAKLDSTLSKLIVGFYHGGNKEDIGRAIAVDQNGLIFVAGNTTSTTNFPVTFPVTIRVTIPGRPGRPATYRDEPGGGANMGQTDGFVASYSANGSIQQSRFFGREGIDLITAMVIDKSSSVYLTGSTTSANFETAPTSDRFSSGRVPYDRTFNGGLTDGFIVKLNNELALAKTDDGTYSTFFGGAGEDEGRGIFVDDLGRASVVGVTTSTNLETIGSMFSQAFGQQDMFMAVLSDDGRDLVSATYFGGTGIDDVTGVRQHMGTSTAVVYGTTISNDLPIEGVGAIGNRSGTSDGFIALINTSTNKFTTLVAGNVDDTVRAVAVDPIGDLYFAASTTSNDLRTSPDSTFQLSGPGIEMYIAKFAFGLLEMTSPGSGDTWCAGSNRTISWSSLGFPDTAKFDIYISSEGSSSWTLVKNDAPGRNYQWKVPALATGKYFIRIQSSRGHISQLTAPFTISNPPTITAQPKNASACPGQPASLSITATGALLKYQWRKGMTDIPNATSSVLEIPAVDASTIGQYSCIVTGACSPSATSQTVTLSTAQATAITTQPTGLTVEQSKPFTLSVRASGSDLAYQWSKDGTPITGAVTSEYVVNASALTDAGSYACEVTGGCGKATSSAVTVVVTPTTSVDDDYAAGKTWLRLLGPTPAFEAAFIRVRQEYQAEATARIVDEQGRTVATLDLGVLPSNESDIRIPVATLSTGVYVVEIQTGAQVGHVRLVVRR